MQLFYNGLTPETRSIVNASAGGSLKNKTYDEVRDLFKKILENESVEPSGKVTQTRRQACMLELDGTIGLGAQLAMITNQFIELKAQMGGRATATCGLC